MSKHPQHHPHDHSPRIDLGVVKHFHVCGGIGSGAAGFNDADPSITGLPGKMVCIGGVDVDARACADFKRLTGVNQTQLDLFTLGQYQAFHGRPPPPGWREACADDVRAAAHHQWPDIVFTSMPCKGFSGLLSAAKSTTAKYIAYNELALRGIFMTMEAFADDPPGLLIFENVPRIASRGRYLLDQVSALMRHYGYASAETVHDCGELGEALAQSRRRFLMVFRHLKKVPPFLYEPPKRPLRAVGEVLGHMPLPGDPAGGPMHRIPALSWKTWVRLAFVEAGSDWRSLNKLAVEDGKLRDFLIVPQTVQLTPPAIEDSAQINGSFAAPDTRFAPSSKWKDGQAFGVRRWTDSTGAIAGQQGPGQGAYSVADIRHQGPAKHSNEFKIVPWRDHAPAVTSAHGSGQAVADPRPSEGPVHSKYCVARFDEAARTVIAGSTTGQGAYAVADVRPGIQRAHGDHYLTAGHYGVVPWTQPSGAVSAAACHDNGRWSVADPRSLALAASPEPLPSLPQPNDKLVCHIQALDGTWHRPFTTLELAALQSIIDPEWWFSPEGPGARGEHFVMDGPSDQRWREGIGNAVPRKAAKAIGTVMGQTILLARTGETFMLSNVPIWVQPLAVAVSVSQHNPL